MKKFAYFPLFVFGVPFIILGFLWRETTDAFQMGNILNETFFEWVTKEDG